MKSKIITIALLFSFFFGCQNVDDKIATDPVSMKEVETISLGLKSVYSETMNFSKNQQLIFEIGKVDDLNIFEFNSKKALANISDHLNKEKFDSKYHPIQYAPSLRIYESIETGRVANINSVTSLFDTTSVYSELQKSLLIDLTSKLLGYENPEVQAIGALDLFDLEIANSSELTREEKIVLVNYSAMYRSFFSFVNEGGIDEIYNSLSSSLPNGVSEANARIQGCKLNTREILIGAAYGAVKSAIIGGLWGAAGGTATLPGIGTVSGAVGGAVFGAASGFTWGVIDGVATGLLGTCFRNVAINSGNCEDVYQRITNGTLNLSDDLDTMYPNCFQRIDKDQINLILNVP